MITHLCSKISNLRKKDNLKNHYNLQSVMIQKAFDLGEEIILKTIEYKLNQNLWNQYDFNGINLDFDGWDRIKSVSYTHLS